MHGHKKPLLITCGVVNDMYSRHDVYLLYVIREHVCCLLIKPTLYDVALVNIGYMLYKIYST